MTTEIEKTPVEQSAIILSENAKALVIATNADRTYAEEMIQSAKTLEDQIFEYLDPARAKAYEQYQFHKKRLDDAIKPVQDARKAVKQKCMVFDAEQERIRREEQSRLEAEARKRAEEEALQAALAAEAEGDKETAEAIIQEPVYVPPVVAPKVALAASRLSAGRSVWSASVFDLRALCKAIGDGKASTEFVIGLGYTSTTVKQLTSPSLNKQASSLKSSMNIPGVNAIERRV